MPETLNDQKPQENPQAGASVLNTLLACPFCGASEQKYLGVCEHKWSNMVSVAVYCYACESYGPPGVDHKQAVSKWNNRAS